MSSTISSLLKANRRFIFILLTFLPCIVHVQKTLAQTVGNKSYDVLLQTLLKHTMPEVSVQQVAAMKNVVLLDARKKREFDVSHLKGAKWIGYSDFDITNISDINKKQPIVIYCSVGFRSEKIAEKLQQAGFKNVSNLYGGIFEWVNNGYEVVNTSGKTLNVHAFNRIWGMWLQKGTKVYH